MFIRYKPRNGNAHIKVIPLVQVVDKSKGEKPVALDRDQIQLLPGMNEVPDKEWNVARLHIKNELNKTIFEITKKAADGKVTAVTLKSYDPKEAVKVVKKTFNPETIKAWYESESRDEVRVAILRKMKKLKMDVPEDLDSELAGNEDDEEEED
jgi:hypothetical protein